MRTTRRVLLGLAAGVIAAAGLLGTPAARAQGGGTSDEQTIDVVATTGMIADAARAVGGDRIAVRALMGPGVDPHAYRQTRTDILALANADLVLWNGLYLEAQMEDFLLDLAETTTCLLYTSPSPRDRG